MYDPYEYGRGYPGPGQVGFQDPRSPNYQPPQQDPRIDQIIKMMQEQQKPAEPPKPAAPPKPTVVDQAKTKAADMAKQFNASAPMQGITPQLMAAIAARRQQAPTPQLPSMPAPQLPAAPGPTLPMLQQMMPQKPTGVA